MASLLEVLCEQGGITFRCDFLRVSLKALLQRLLHFEGHLEVIF